MISVWDAINAFMSAAVWGRVSLRNRMKTGSAGSKWTDPQVTGGDDPLYHIHDIQESVKKDTKKSAWSRALSPAKRLAALNRQFANLNLEDYLRHYTDRSAECRIRKPDKNELERIFTEMNKNDEASRNINCSCCGYATCHDMAVAIHNGFNHKENCVHYLKGMVEREKEEAQELVEREREMINAQKEEILRTVNEINGHRIRDRGPYQGTAAVAGGERRRGLIPFRELLKGAP